MAKLIAIVFGAGAERLLGVGLCRRFAAEGHHVLVVGRTGQKIDQVVASIRNGGGSADPITADVTNEPGAVHAFDRAFSPAAAAR